MKNLKHLLFILLSITSLSSYAQTSKKTLNYQAVILDPNAIDIPGASISGQPLSKGNVCLRFSLLNTAGGVDYEETQQATTDEFGLVSLTIGTGTPSSGTSIYKSFESIVWNANVKSLKVSVSYDGCSSFKQVSTQALNYTPYALYAEAVDYKNVREAPTKLSQFSNDAGYLIPKDLDPIKAEIKSNTSQIQTASQSIADNKLANDAAFLIVNQSLTSLDKQVADNTSSITTMNSRINDQQNQIITNNNTMNAQFGGLQGQLNVTNSTVSNLTGAAEVVSNKSASTTLGGASTSDQLYPTQRATKTYVDQAIAVVANGTISDATTLAAGKIQLAGDLSGTATSPTVPALAGKENTSNKSLNVQADGTNDTKYPSVKAVKDYVDQATQGTALAADLAAKANTSDVTTSLALKEDVSNKSNAALGTSTTLYPTQSAVKTYVDAQVASATIVDADATTKGKIQLTGDLGGTATSPTVPGLLLKEDVSNKSNAALGTSTTLYPTQSAVKTYVDAQVASATIVDADASTKGKIQLTGDLGGTASSPTVPGLTAKANIASPTFTGTLTAPIYASAPQNLTDAATISWNPANGLNANVTLGGNRTLSFSSTPASGSYGTLVVTQDGTGGRTLTLPSGTNKVLGSASTTTIALSSAANAKDILNFYYDGLTSTYYWNVGQGYGIAETIESTNLGSAVTGTLPVANGGTGATTAGAALTALGAQASANLSTDISGDAASLTKYPAVKTVKDYVDATVSSGAPDASTTVKGKIQLAGDLAGTATSPSVVKLRGTPISSVAPTTAGHVLTYDVNGNATWAAPANSANTISGVVPVANGGTGLSSVTSGGAVYATSSNALATGTLPLTAGGTGATTAAAALTALGAAPIASPTFTGTLTAPIYASAPQNLTDAATISWNPASGLNAGVTLGGNRTLSFSTAPASGSYGTLVITQDGTGGRTLTLPSTTNKVLGSTSTTTVALSSAANAKDILNFYFDGTTYFWNIGQGYGTAATITANNLAGGAAGSIPYQTGAGATGFLAKGTDGQVLTLASGVPSWTAAAATGVTSVAMSTPTGLSVTGSPITSSGTLALSMTTGYAIPTTASQTNWDAAYTNRITSASSPLSIASNAISLATVPVSSGGTGATTLTANNVLLGNGTSALQAVAPGTSGNVLTSDGTTWTSAAGGVPYSGATGAVNLGAYDLKVNNLTIGRGRLGVESNTAIGLASLGVNTTGTNNTGTGYATLAANTEGIANTATGYGSLVANTTGSNNTAVGSTSLVKNLTGSNNTALGYVSLSENLSGINNTGVGSYSLWKNTGSGNSAVGFGALVYNTNGSNNVAQGSSALQDNTTGSDNTAIGRNSLMTNSTGSFNTAIGSVTNVNSNNLSNTTAIGYGARVYNSNTIQLGADGTSYTLNSVVYPTTAITNVKTSGTLTLGTVTYPNSHASTDGQILTINSSGLASWATPAASGIPYSGATGAVNLGGYDLTVNGVTVGRGNMKMTNNYAFGYAVLSANTTGNYNNAFGHQALTANTTGTENIAFGEYVLPKNIGGSQNTAVGSNALKENTTGNGNTGYGRQALATNTTGSYNTAIGYQANVATNNLTNATAIGNGASVSTSNTIQLGNTDVTNVKTSGTITAGDITYPKTHGSVNQVLTTSGSGTLTWATPSTTATAYSGTLPIANGGTNSTATATSGGIGYGTGTAHAYTSAGSSGQVLISAGTGTPTWATLTAGSAITISNSGGAITIAAAVRPMTEQVTATSAHAVATATFTLGNTPLNTKVWMFINGVRTNNNAYTISGTTVTYTAANNNSYTIVAGDRIQFDYAY